MKMGWLLGWAVPESWFAPLVRKVYPHESHLFVSAGPTAIEQLRAVGPLDQVTGYSLGSQLLLAAAADGARLGSVTLLAPIFAFPREEELGGRVARSQVRLLMRWLRSDPAAALADFYGRAGLDITLAQTPVEERENLRWGLEYLDSRRVEPPLPPGWRAWCGSADALLDPAQLVGVAPDIVVVPEATHHPAGLLRAIAEGKK